VIIKSTELMMKQMYDKLNNIYKKRKQSRYRPEVTQRIPGS